MSSRLNRIPRLSAPYPGLIRPLLAWWSGRPLRRLIAGLDASIAHSEQEAARLSLLLAGNALSGIDALNAQGQLQLHGMSLIIARIRRERLRAQLLALGAQA